MKLYTERKSKIKKLESELMGMTEVLKKKEMNALFSIDEKRMQERNLEFIQKRQELIHKKRNQELEKEERLKKLAESVIIQSIIV